MNSRNLKVIERAADRGKAKTPCLCPDGGYQEGTLLILEYPVVCVTCGGIATQRMSFVWKGTTAKNFNRLSTGASVKHYFTVCNECGATAAG